MVFDAEDLKKEPGNMAHACGPSTFGAEAAGF